MDERTVHIYVLIDPRDSKVRYVGSTLYISQTFSRHMTQRGNKKKTAWIDELKGVGLKPELKIIDTTSITNRVEDERKWIAHHLKSGDSLLNGEYTHEFNREAAGLPRSWYKEYRKIADELGDLLSKIEKVPAGNPYTYNHNYLISRAMQIAIETLRKQQAE